MNIYKKKKNNHSTHYCNQRLEVLIFTKLSQNIIDIFQHLTWCSCSSNKFSRSGHAETAFTSHANYKGTNLRLHIVVILILKCWQQITSITSSKIIFGSIRYFWKKTRPFELVSCRNSSTVFWCCLFFNGMEWNSLDFFLIYEQGECCFVYWFFFLLIWRAKTYLRLQNHAWDINQN